MLRGNNYRRTGRRVMQPPMLLVGVIVVAALPAIVAARDAAPQRSLGTVLIAGGDRVERCAPCLHPENTWFVGDHRGFSYTMLTSAELYRATDGVFVRGGEMGAKLAHPIAALLANHNVLFSGWTVQGHVVTPRIGRALYDSAAGKFLPAGQVQPSCDSAAYQAMVWTLGGELELKISKSGRRVLYQDGVVSGLPSDCAGDVLNAVARVSAAVTPGGEATLLLDGKVLVSHPPDNHPCGAVEIYDPATGDTMPVGRMHAVRSGYSVTQLKDGKLLIAGGRHCANTFGCDPGTGTILDSAEIYDPATRRFAPTGKMNEPRYYHTAIRLADGRVLLAGGEGRNGESLVSAELYDPSTGSFSRTGAMTIPRQRAAAILLP